MIEHEIVASDPKARSILTSWWRLRRLATDKQVSRHSEIREGAGYLAHEMGMNGWYSLAMPDVETLTPT